MVSDTYLQNNERIIDKLSVIINTFGGKLVLYNDYAEHDRIRHEKSVDKCPFDSRLAINIKSKIAHAYKATNGCINWVGLVHEMGHLFCTKDITTDEYPFFGWEYLIAKNILEEEVDWIRQCDDYRVEHPITTELVDFEELSKINKKKVLRKAIQLGKDKGYISKSGHPLINGKKII